MDNQDTNSIELCRMCGSPVRIVRVRSTVKTITDAEYPLMQKRVCTNESCASNDPSSVRTVTDEV